MGRLMENGRESGGGEAGFCPRCQRFIDDGPDACLGTIPGASHACCGHGDTEQAYVVLGGQPNQSCTEIDTVTISGAAALAFFALVETGTYRSPSPEPDFG